MTDKDLRDHLIATGALRPHNSQGDALTPFRNDRDAPVLPVGVVPRRLAKKIAEDQDSRLGTHWQESE